DHINVDVTALKVGETLHIGEIVAPEGVELLGDKKIPVFAVAAPLAAEAAETPAASADGATAASAAKQPEMIKEKKEEAPADKGGAKKK
ncbi:MAG: 50S ribosomal protein L25, partial [Verrucomicrobiae bacterium]|nr:50S ribosomal protein L25 [Verrucomicrobiae bacterium]